MWLRCGKASVGTHSLERGHSLAQRFASNTQAQLFPCFGCLVSSQHLRFPSPLWGAGSSWLLAPWHGSGHQEFQCRSPDRNLPPVCSASHGAPKNGIKIQEQEFRLDCQDSVPVPPLSCTQYTPSGSRNHFLTITSSSISNHRVRHRDPVPLPGLGDLHPSVLQM